MAIPIIDLFAGPGGMGEGFSSLHGGRFRLSVSIEKDPMAHQTLRLRSAFRELQRKQVGRHVWRQWYWLIDKTPWQLVFNALSECPEPAIVEACQFANAEAWNLEMAADNRAEVIAGIEERLEIAGFDSRPDHCLVIGGPPCQAYSVVGRSRNRGKSGYRAEDDHRHFLYKEYLNVLKEFQPVAFVMENVKGILTSQIDGAGIFEAVMRDLRNPGLALGAKPTRGYRLLALSAQGLLEEHPQADDFIIRAEDHGVPQNRHRVIIVGVRRDLELPPMAKLKLVKQEPVTVADAIADMPRLRSELSKRSCNSTWDAAVASQLTDQVIADLSASDSPFHQTLARQMKNISLKAHGLATNPTGADRYHGKKGDVTVRTKAAKNYHEWVKDKTHMPYVANHETRTHRADDLVRYLFVSLFGWSNESPRLQDFPRSLLPNHKNIDPDNLDAAIFKDRFRVQVASKPATTVTSHIAKDGHYFIHYDPEQCRSLTVREGARLQSFPDNYIFLGNRTSQYTQVGNAVPPLLAKQVAEVVHNILSFNRL